MTSAAPAVKAGLVAACRVVYADTSALVTYGLPGTSRPDEIVAVMGATTNVERGAMAPARRRREEVETVVVISVSRSGNESVQQVVTERAYELLDLLVEYLRVSPNESLGGACREARVTEHELEESVVYNSRDASKATGRNASIAALVTSTTDRI